MKSDILMEKLLSIETPLARSLYSIESINLGVIFKRRKNDIAEEDTYAIKRGSCHCVAVQTFFT